MPNPNNELSGPTPRPVHIAVLTVSDTRTLETDTSGELIVSRLAEAGHNLADRQIVADDTHRIRKMIVDWCSDDAIEVVIAIGGTGLTGRDVTADVLPALYTKAIPGFGELFRWLSYRDIGTSTIQSRACGGLIDSTMAFALPGSTGACRLAWDEILRFQLDVRQRPCNLVELMPRFSER
jgi:molybdenum cofactor biosynthesis protein B